MNKTNQPDEIMQSLLYLLHRVASHPDLPENVLGMLCIDCAPTLLERVAQHAKCSPTILEKLAAHNCVEVRIAVSDSSNVTPEILENLALDNDPDVRYAIAENHRMPISVLESLVQDDNPYVACRAQRTLDRITEKETNNQNTFGLPQKFKRTRQA